MDNKSHKPKREVKSSKFKQRIVDVAYKALVCGKIRSRKDNSTSVEKQVQQSPEVSDCGDSPIDSNTTNWSKVPMSEKQLPYKIKEKRGASSIESPAIKSTKRIKLVEYEHSSTTESASETERVDTSSKSPEQSPVRKAKVAIPRANRVNSASSSADPLTESVSMTGSTARSLHHPWNSLYICLGDRGSQSTDLNLNFQSNSQVDNLHSQMERRCRDLEIWSQDDLINLWAQETEVIDMMDKQHYNFGSLSKHEGLVLKNVPYTKVCALRYYKNDMFGVEVKLDNLDNPWKNVNIRKLCRQKTRVGMPQEIASFPSPMAIPSVPRKLSKAKIDCLKDYIKYMNGSNKEWLENILKNCA